MLRKLQILGNSPECTILTYILSQLLTLLLFGTESTGFAVPAQVIAEVPDKSRGVLIREVADLTGGTHTCGYTPGSPGELFSFYFKFTFWVSSLIIYYLPQNSDSNLILASSFLVSERELLLL